MSISVRNLEIRQIFPRNGYYRKRRVYTTVSPMKARNALILTALILAAASLFAGHTAQPSTAARGAFMAVDFIVLALTLAETALDLARSPLMLGYVRKRWASSRVSPRISRCSSPPSGTSRSEALRLSAANTRT
jgi:hypothetical protein